MFYVMITLTHNPWIRLVRPETTDRPETTVWQGQWPEPHRVGDTIHATAHGSFLCNTTGVEVVYALVAKKPCG